MAGPGFDGVYKRDPKLAAKNVQCIHTSWYAGTHDRNCHQNWLMGHCGRYQSAEDDAQDIYCALFRQCKVEPINSHSMCPFLYNSAFKNSFVFDNRNKCSSDRMAKNLPKDFRMGYMGFTDTAKKWVSNWFLVTVLSLLDSLTRKITSMITSLRLPFSVHQLLAIFPHPLLTCTHTPSFDACERWFSYGDPIKTKISIIISCSTYLGMSES